MTLFALLLRVGVGLYPLVRRSYSSGSSPAYNADVDDGGNDIRFGPRLYLPWAFGFVRSASDGGGDSNGFTSSDILCGGS